MRIAILGGTGSFGKAVAKRLVQAGEDVVIGSRDAERAREAGAEIGCEGAENAEAVRGAGLAVLAVKAEAALETSAELAGALGDTPLLSVASTLGFSKDGVRPDPHASSIAERVADLVPGPVIAGLHSLAASNLGGDQPPEEDALVCGDDADAKALVLALAERLVSGRAVDCGPLASARALEGMTAVIVNVNRRYKAHAGLKVTGLP
ncbi:MAG: 8-hydroxy-5-deazaflavin:NADPH oxidoreductase [Gaiellaceae bacterium]|nr:8-hydroxy-5-deazaflavin:NADPH oxidoreductase [Gaiellaceae bacterium]